MTALLLEYDEAVDAADGSVIGVEILCPRRKGVLFDGLPYRDDVVQVMRSVGFRLLEPAR